MIHSSSYTETDIVYRLLKRAEIRNSITSRKSVLLNQPDRLSELLIEAANEIKELREFILKGKDNKWVLE